MMNEENGMSSVQTTAGRRIAQEEQTDRPAGKKTGLIIGIVAGALVLGYAALCVVAQTVYGHRAFPNTTVLGLDVSGMSAQQAEHLWQEKGTAVLENTVIALTRQSYILGEVTLAELGGVSLDALEQNASELLQRVHDGMFEKAKKNLDEHIYDAETLEEAKRLQQEHGGFIRTMWCGDVACENRMKEEAGMSSRCMPFRQEHLSDVCAICGKPAKKMIYWGVAY